MSANQLPYSQSAPVPFWKRATDIFCCLLALPVCALLTLVMSALVSVCSPGPVFFRQERVGVGRRRFLCYKFRTMVVRADTGVHREHFAKLMDTNAPMAKIDGQRDSRLIPGGWILRASGLDELPQIFNILKGEMSIVGPRPCIPYEAEKYLPWQMERFDTVPGLTGLWQVSGKNRTTFAEMMQLDIKYVREKSWLLDIWIILLTVPTILLQFYDTRQQRRKAAQSASPFAASATPADSFGPRW
jgi:lipopolysaccharide/colanic/teichoic acid biosynthesis glycosyltransferase